MLLLVVAALWPGRAEGYYYDAAQDPLAASYVGFAGALAADPPDWAEAERRLAAVAPEVRLVFGDCVLEPLRAAVDRRDAEAARAGFRRLLVLNVARRLAQARSAMTDDYPAAKTALARANSTYEALAPEVKAADTSLDARIRRDLEAMADALGNPGLFGVGRRKPDPASFDRHRLDVVAALQARFGPRGVAPERLDRQPCPGGGAAGGGGRTGRLPALAWGAAAVGLAVVAARVLGRRRPGRT